MCWSSGGDGGAAAQARADELQREGDIKSGTQSIDKTLAQFNDAFYHKRGQDYLDYAVPQLDDQYKDAQKNLVFALSRKGTLNSSMAADNYAKLGRQYSAQHGAIEGNALDLENAARGDVENTRSTLLSQLYASADPSNAAQQAITQASLLNRGPTFSPLGALFTDLSAYAANSAASRDANYGSGGGYGVKLYSGGRSPGYAVGG